MTLRALTDRERMLARWIIEHGDASASGKDELIAQLARAMVAARCPCGCASVDFAIDGAQPALSKGFNIVGDFICGSGANICGVFVFCRGSTLAGLEIWQVVGDTRDALPSPNELRPFGSVT